MDLESGEIHKDHDKKGEILIRSTQCFDRYLNNEEATAASFTEGPDGQKWFKTGDYGRFVNEKDGSTQILGRISQDMIIKQGYNVSALELESNLMQVEAVQECAVIGVPHEKYGEEIVAFIVLKPGQNASAKELEDYMRK